MAVIQIAATKVHADILLVDIGPNLGVINRSVLVATDYVAIPLGADLLFIARTEKPWPNFAQLEKPVAKTIEQLG